MKKAIATFVLVGGLAMMSVPALAETPAKNPAAPEQAQKVQLEQRSTQLARRLQGGSKLGAARENEIHRQLTAINELIRKLDAGGEVAPGEVERVLQAH